MMDTTDKKMSHEEMIEELKRGGYSVKVTKRVDSQAKIIAEDFIEWAQTKQLDPGKIIESYFDTFKVGLYKITNLRNTMKSKQVHTLRKEGEEVPFTARFETRIYTSYIPHWLQVALSQTKDKDIPVLVDTYAYKE